jgi:acyl-coenzyme A synthetase/AMP-(fatty) acid ligase
VLDAPFRLRMLLDAPALSRADLSSLRTLVYGGALMHAADLTEAMTLIGPVLCQLCGQGESPMTISYLSTNEHRLERAARMCCARREWRGPYGDQDRRYARNTCASWRHYQLH